MQLWKIAALAIAIPASTTAVKAAEPAARPSCLQAFGPLGSAPGAALTVVDASTLEGPSDLRSLRKKAKDGKPIIIKGGNFSGKKFGDDDFSNLCFDGTNLSGTRWSKSRAEGAAFINANLTGAVFDRANLRGVLFRNSILTRMDASGGNLAYGQLDGGWDPSIAGLRLENAQMTGFRFVCGASSADGCPFDRKQISLRGANLSNASLASFALWDANLVDVVLNNTEIALDQIAQYANANVQGPLIVRAGEKKTQLSAAAFQLAVTAFSTPAKPDTECNDPSTALSQIFCQAGQSALRAYRDDVDRLYQSTVTMARPDGTNITVVGPGKEQERYLSALRKCALKAEDKAISCIGERMTQRRAALVAQLTKSNPLEPDVRALFVNVQTPLLQTISQDVRLAGLTPLLIGSAPSFLLAYRDEQDMLNGKGVSQNLEGLQCSYNFAPLSPRKGSGKTAGGKKAAGPAFAAWSSGAEFTVAPRTKTKQKKAKKPRKGKRGVTTAIAANTIAPQPVITGTGCGTSFSSGPLVRVPLSEDDFDLLWTKYQTPR
jgi:uncharacterized protein YjbI with pentapeptide repeats